MPTTSNGGAIFFSVTISTLHQELNCVGGVGHAVP